jgi:hypothetical protein
VACGWRRSRRFSGIMRVIAVKLIIVRFGIDGPRSRE